MSVEAFGGDGSGVEEGRHDADGRIVLAGEMERRPLAPPAGRRGGIPGLLAGVGLFGEQVDCLAPSGLVAELLVCSTLIAKSLHVTCTRIQLSIVGTICGMWYVPLRRDKRKDTNLHIMCWVRETFVQAKKNGPRHIHSSNLSTNDIWGEGGNNYVQSAHLVDAAKHGGKVSGKASSREKDENWCRYVLLAFRLIEIERGYQ